MENPYADRVNRNVRRLAKKRLWSLERVALEAGLSRSHFFYILSGQRTPSLAALKRVADALGVDLIELLRP